MPPEDAARPYEAEPVAYEAEPLAYEPEPEPEKYQPLALITVILGALLMFAVFFLGFLVAPLAILILFYVGFAASDRSKRGAAGGGEAAPAEGELTEAELAQLQYDEQLAAEEQLAADTAARRAAMGSEGG